MVHIFVVHKIYTTLGPNPHFFYAFLQLGDWQPISKNQIRKECHCRKNEENYRPDTKNQTWEEEKAKISLQQKAKCFIGNRNSFRGL